MAQGFVPQTRVRVRSTGQTGTVCPDLQGMLTDSPDGVPVVIDGMGTSQEASPSDLDDLGPENAVADEACGRGKGADCCIFMVFGPDGFQCERFGSMRWTLIFKKAEMASQREPIAAYPDCKVDGWANP